MKQIIVVGHGHFASGIQSAINVLAGDRTDIDYLDFGVSDSEQDLKNKIQVLLDNNREADILFFCDLLGGTPYKVSAQFAYSSTNYEVVAGCNLGSLMEILFTKDKISLSQLAAEIVQTSRQHTGCFLRNNTKREDNESFEDGI